MKNKKVKTQEIRTNPDQGTFSDWDYSFSGRFKDKSEFIIHNNQTGKVVASLSGYRLYRLAKAIVNRYERSRSSR